MPGKKTGRGGSRPYNAPEKYTSAEPSHLSDIFALGVIFFELYFNRHPYYTAEEWEDIKKNKPQAAEQELDVFSDLVWYGVLNKVEYLEHISSNPRVTQRSMFIS